MPKLPFWIALSANALVLALSVPFYWVPKGTSVRPTAWAFYVFCIAIAAVAALVINTPIFNKHRPQWWVWVTIIASVTPLPLSLGILYSAVALGGLLLEP